MAIGLLGKKLGMTHIYDPYGRHVAVTAVQAGPCTILRLRAPEKDGYDAVQVGFEVVKERKVSKPELGQFKKAGTEPFRFVHEFRLPRSPAGQGAGAPETQKKEAKGAGQRTDESGEQTKETKGAQQPSRQKQAGGAGTSTIHAGWTVGQKLTVELFKQYELVDVSGISIGKGFQGGMKRWGWSGGPESHGSMSHRTPGSIGASAFPSRVVKGHHLPGHMGAARVTVENLRIVDVDREANLLFIEGAIPGPERSLVVVEKSTKRFEVVKAPLAIVAVAEEEEVKGKRGKVKKK